jgi:hypothetical protein
MTRAIQPAKKKEETDLEELLSNEFAAGVIRGIKESKAGKGKTYKSRDEFLDSLESL